VLGNGMVINPRSFFEELDMLRAAGIAVTPQRLRVSHAAHLITPAHSTLDKALERARGKDNLGTTGRGIGPAYTDKAARRGLRMSEVLHPDFIERLGEYIDESNRALSLLATPALDIAPILDIYKTYAEKLAPYLADTATEVYAALRAGQHILAEAGQGTLLDLDHGTYPFVTSSSTTAPGALIGLGLGLGAANGAQVTGVCKAFQTRVGSGPFPTEVFDKLALRLRGTGENPWDEYGTTTGRARRVGWLDGVLLRYAVRVNGLTELVITKLDILSGIETLRLCVGYESNGKRYDDIPYGPTALEGYQPIYEEFPGWSEDVSHIRTWAELPAAAKTYLERIASLTSLPISLVSVGPERNQLISVK